MSNLVPYFVTNIFKRQIRLDWTGDDSYFQLYHFLSLRFLAVDLGVILSPFSFWGKRKGRRARTNQVEDRRTKCECSRSWTPALYQYYLYILFKAHNTLLWIQHSEKMKSFFLLCFLFQLAFLKFCHDPEVRRDRLVLTGTSPVEFGLLLWTEDISGLWKGLKKSREGQVGNLFMGFFSTSKGQNRDVICDIWAQG